MNRAKAFQFVRSADKFLECWDSDQSASKLEMWLGSMRTIGLPHKCFFKPLKAMFKSKKHGFDSEQFAEAVVPFVETLAAYRSKYELELEVTYLKSILEMLYPWVASREESRGLPSYSKLSLATKISNILSSTTNFGNSYNLLAEMCELQYRCLVKFSKGQKPSKEDGQKIKELRRELQVAGS